MRKNFRFTLFLSMLLLVLGSIYVWFSPADPGQYSQRVSIVPSANANASPTYPDAPSKWHGKTDYVQLDARIRQMMKSPEMAGLAVAVIEDDRLSFVQGYGLANRATDEPVTPNTVFRWASVSKGVAATLVAELVADRKLSWKTPIANYGTTLRLPGHAESRLGLDAILSHRLGLPKNAYDGWLEGGKSPAFIRGSLANVAPLCVPGQCHSYQNVAYDTVSEIVQNVTGKSYADQVEKRLFLPLGMTGASVGRDGLVGAKSWARPYRGMQQLDVAPSYYRIPAAAGVNSTIIDLATWMRAQMGDRPKVLSPAVLTTIHTPQIATKRIYGSSAIGMALKNPAYGMGWRSFTFEDEPMIGHSGAVNGYRAAIMFDPKTRTGIAMLWNSSSARPFRLQHEFFDSYRGRKNRNWLELKDAQTAAAAQYVATAGKGG